MSEEIKLDRRTFLGAAATARLGLAKGEPRYDTLLDADGQSA